MTASRVPAWKLHPGRPCKDGDLWTSDDKAEIGQAARLCRTKACPVLQECGNWALDNGERHHVWGGLNFNTQAVRSRVTKHLAEKAEVALERQLRELYGRGLSDPAIGLRMGRPSSEINKLRRRFGLPTPFDPASWPVTTEVAA